MTPTSSTDASVNRPWRQDEDELLVEHLRDGLELSDIAELHGRSLGAIKSRVSSMVPRDDEHPPSGKARVEWLREQLAAGDYDWRTPLRSRTSPFAWRAEEDDRLRHDWATRTPLVEVAEALRRSERMLVRRLVQLGLAKNLTEVVDRLGCDPDGPLPIELAIGNGALGPSVHVLLGVDDDGRPVHVSLHESAAAAQALSVAVSEREQCAITWQTIERQVGGPGYADPAVGYSLPGGQRRGPYE